MKKIANVGGAIERPMLYQGAMVRAILGDSKTQTRRVAKEFDGLQVDAILKRFPKQSGCRFGQPGDRLWVRETFFAYGRWVTRFKEKKGRDEWHFVDMTIECDRAYQYAADEPEIPLATGRGPLPGWWKRPAIFMPRAACRIQLEIVSVRVERLNDCSDIDALAEGCSTKDMQSGDCLASVYARLWESINGAGSWAANPWVWVVEFKRVTP